MSYLPFAMINLCADMQSLLVAITCTAGYPRLVADSWCITPTCDVRM